MNSKDHPNILFILADQMRSHALGCYGNTQVSTPNFDRLASEGVRFTNAISTHPVCGPYRAMLMTGNFPFRNGMLQTDHHMRNPGPTFAEVCSQAGYDTAYIGKFHLDGREGRSGPISRERRLGFDYWRGFECTHDYFNSRYYHQDELKPRTWDDYDAISQTRDACQYFSKVRPNPFFMVLSWGPPHGPYVAPEKYMNRWKDRDIELRENVNDFNTSQYLWEKSDTILPDRFLPMRKNFKERLSDRDNVTIESCLKAYYASIECLDDCLGELLDSLESSGQLDNTIVVFTSDHGDSLGSHRQWAKQLPFEECLSVPFLARYPATIPDRLISPCLVAPTDIMPSLLSLAGLGDIDVQGKDLSSAFKGRSDPCPDGVLIQKMLPLSTNWITNGNGPWCGIRTHRYTYARLSYSGTPWLLYDNEEDPYQLNNLVDLPNYKELRDELNGRTDRLLEESGEPGDPRVYAITLHEEMTQAGVETWSLEELFPEIVTPTS